MIACVDVHYRDTRAVAAGIAFRGWLDESVVAEQVITVSDIQPYNPGKFFVRELPCLLAVLEKLPAMEIVLIDGYVRLEKDRPGLGAHLYTSLESRIPVIGVAKTRYVGAENAQEIVRGKSKQPLYISAAGLSVREAAEHVRSMHGPYRIPTLLKRVDRLSRSKSKIPSF
jgi:deoxyribonuclease V